MSSHANLSAQVEFFDPASVMGFVLAGGRSRRMGVDKANIVIDGRTAIDRQLELIRSLCSDNVAIIGSVPAPSTASGLNNRPVARAPVADSHGGQGPLDGLVTALQYAQNTDIGNAGEPGLTSTVLRRPIFALVIAVDLWSVTATDIGRLFATMADPALGPMTDVAYLRGPSGDQPLCAVWRIAESLEVLKGAFLDGERSVVRAWMGLRRTAVAVPESVVANINTPEDVEEWRARQREAPDRLKP